MPTSRYFDPCPPFPKDVPVLEIPQISFQQLQNGNHETTVSMFEACREYGFFLLDLIHSDEGATLLQDAEKMFELTTETFALGSETLEKHAYDPPRDLTGYKATGKLKTDDGKQDLMEMYGINQDDIVGNVSPRKNAEPIESRRNDIKQFILHSHTVIKTIQYRLDEQLGVSPGTLGSLNPLDETSDTSVRILRSHQQPAQQESSITLGGHTDFGTMTLLFNVLGGLQVLPAGRCAIVNVGDTTVEWTGGLLRSSLHRVIRAPGEQGSVPRQSVAYLVRARRNASMSRLKGGIIPPLGEGEQDETRSVRDWEAWRAMQIISGQLKPQTRGGNPILPKQRLE
ncbi:uncharacterized protein N7496_004697 [Penicillium cataractarum]|uniref:Fe2OG dioxygenase domain-containing protein n=1 Tax=Penicillium cataractarum TaxID=2100454 RepID=A0A9W9VCQ6_9EURO|nr:uncharacterized protein N7496_004697 [Penicillium cataractarum]KAJ5377288.1 hypothetical protein N7496_004697 [Penicillium cataractarum]